MNEPIWIDEHDARTVHDLLLAQHGGPAGIRDPSLLQSALMRPQQLYAYGDKPDLVEMATAYIAGIVKNHPFVDGNKRTGFVVGAMFLELNQLKFIASEEEATRAIINLASGAFDEGAFATWLRANVKEATPQD
jgi:death-on-curing protein